MFASVRRIAEARTRLPPIQTGRASGVCVHVRGSLQPLVEMSTPPFRSCHVSHVCAIERTLSFCCPTSADDTHGFLVSLGPHEWLPVRFERLSAFQFAVILRLPEPRYECRCLLQFSLAAKDAEGPPACLPERAGGACRVRRNPPHFPACSWGSFGVLRRGNQIAQTSTIRTALRQPIRMTD